MQYMALIYADETAWDGLSARSVRASTPAINRSPTMPEPPGSCRVVTSSAQRGTQPPCAFVTARLLVVDGPYAEAKEALGGYFLFECSSIDEAVDWAARIPAVEHGAVEVRPVYFDPAEA